ncbi:MAG: discoidin domain-containing protein [Bacteroidaceae bacterium]|nr:discoidin domain-containing protein [Bacteroidaceae bacterium]
MMRKFLLPLLLVVSSVAYGQANKETLFLISNTHLDTQWNWDVKTTINEYIKNTLTQNMALMDKYPKFMLNYEGAIKYMWMKEYYPTEYEKMKEYITRGQWHVSGMSLDATDVMMSSAESILHSMLYANKFYQREFGVRGGYDIMLPDCFGFSYSLPTLAKHAGIKGFHTAKLGWGSAAYNSLPPFGIWQGVDGSQIYAVYKPGAYDTHEDFNKDLTSDADMLKKIQENYSNYGVAAQFRYVGPRGDRGGGLQDNASKEGENTPYWLDYNVGKTDGKIQVKLATPDEFFDYLDQYKNSKYKVWNSELPMKTHGVGSYTSWGLLKKWNRRNELLADAAEKASSLSYWLGVADYPTEALRDAWIRTIWQQHHDGITGTSTLKANEYSYNEYYIANRAFGQQLTNAIGATSQMLDTQVEGIPMVVYNPLSHNRTDIVEGSMAYAQRPYDMRVIGPDGEEVLSQITGYDEKAGQVSFIFAATVPSLGYAVYDVRLGEKSELTSPLHADEFDRQFSNGRYSVTINANGDIQKLYDNQNSRTLINSAVRQQMIYDHEDTWPAWEISYTDVCRTPSEYVSGEADIHLVEDGPLRKSFRISRHTAGSTFIQYVRMTALSNRIDCVNEVDWHTPERMLKVSFPFYFSASKDTYDISLGTLQRGIRSSDEYEVCAHQWADHSSSAYGVSILNDCKYGWDKPDTRTLRLTLQHTPSCKNYDHQANMDIGPNSYIYSIFPHDGKWSQQTQMEAAHLNQPLMAFVAPKHAGSMGKTLQFATLNTDQVSIKALKKAEETDELIVRVYEWCGQDQKDVSIHFPAEIVSVREVNALEEDYSQFSILNFQFSGDSLTFDIGHYQPKTFAVRLKSPSVESMARGEGTPATLTYNIDVMSYDKLRGNANTTYSTYAYPAELISDTMVVDGVRFAMGDRTDAKTNAMRISGTNAIPLNRQSGENKLYLLMASATEAGSTVTVSMGEEDPVTVEVPYYSGKIGEPLSCTNLGSSYRKQNVAFASSHAHNISDKSNEAMTLMYLYKYCIALPEGVNEVKLSSTDRKTFVFAATTSASHTDDLVAFTPVTTEIDYNELGADAEDNRLVPKSVTASYQNGTNEAAKMANDKNPTTKWCATSSQSKTPYLQYVFGEPVRVDRWMVLCAASESGGYVAEAFKLQYQKDDGTWVDFADITSNQTNKVSRSLAEPVTATRFRLQMVHGEQGDGYTTRIYEFALYGQTVNEYETGVEEIQDSKFKIQNNEVYDLAGRRVYSNSKIQNSKLKDSSLFTLHSSLKKGVYIVNGKKKILP